LGDSVLLLKPETGARRGDGILASVARARGVVLDLRGQNAFPDSAALLRALMSDGDVAPLQRALRYDGFPPATFQTSGGYGVRYRPIPGERFVGRGRRDQAVAIIADGGTVLPAFVLALRQSGRSRLIGVEASRVASAGEGYRVAMGEGVNVVTRLAERVGLHDGVPVDVSLTARSAWEPVVLFALQQPAKPHPPAATLDTSITITLAKAPTSAEWTVQYPSTGYRLLAASRLWGTIAMFFPYKAHMGESWDRAFRAALPAIENAGTALDYGKSLVRFATHVHDSHVNVGSAALYEDVLGQQLPPVLTAMIEGKVIVTRVIDSSATRAGLRVGDEIVTVNGEAVGARMANMSPYIVTSTPQSLQSRLMSSVLSATAGMKTLRLSVRNADGVLRTIETPFSNTSYAARTARVGSVFRVMPGNVGYVDLVRLPNAMVDSMFRVFAGTKAIVFDMRGYPQGTGWSIAPRINTRPEPTTAAHFRRLVVSSPDSALTRDFTFEQSLPSLAGRTRYTGRTAMLINEQAISQSEHTALFFERANGTAFIGSPTAGANGDVTNFLVPGGISITFSGHDVRHIDGRQLQRVGIVPTVAVTPTVAGVRAGRDEVLEAGLKYVGGTGEVPVDTYVAPVPKPRRVVAPEPAPAGWTWFGNSENFRLGLDTSVAYGGRSSEHITALLENGGFGALNQTIRADEYRGQRVRVSAFIRTRNVGRAGTIEGASIWARVDGAGGMLAFDNMASRQVRGTTDWQAVSVVLDVPTDAEAILMGLLLSTDGEAWIDDISLERVGSEVPPTTQYPPARSPARAAAMTRQYEALPKQPTNLYFERAR